MMVIFVFMKRLNKQVSEFDSESIKCLLPLLNLIVSLIRFDCEIGSRIRLLRSQLRGHVFFINRLGTLSKTSKISKNAHHVLPDLKLSHSGCFSNFFQFKVI